jgi:hypothetical protein
MQADEYEGQLVRTQRRKRAISGVQGLGLGASFCSVGGWLFIRSPSSVDDLADYGWLLDGSFYVFALGAGLLVFAIRHWVAWSRSNST